MEQAHPDRPIECSECQRNICVHYTEMVNDRVNRTGHCQECPQLQKRLHGMKAWEEAKKLDGAKGLVCGECGTSLETIQMGGEVGCSNCYDVFYDVIAGDLVQQHFIKHLNKVLHIGRTPTRLEKISPSLKLIALNEALSSTLKAENYEQAAWLRDQIKQLTDESHK